MDVDSLLSTGSAFTDGPNILGRVYETYDFLLEILDWPLADPTVSVPHRVCPDFVLDTVNRSRLDHLLFGLARGHEVGGHEVGGHDVQQDQFAKLREAHITSAGRLLAAEAEVMGDRLRVRVGDHDVDLVAAPGRDAPGHRAFCQLYREHLCTGNAAHQLTGIDATDATVVRAAVELLDRVLPRLTAGVLQHVAYLAQVIGPDAFESASTRPIPSAVFVSEHCFSSPARLAEALLHEAVHHRFYDLQLTRSIFVRGYDTSTAPTIAPEWHARSTVTEWPLDRGLAAAHVYVHLTAWFQLLVEHSPTAAQRQAAAESSTEVACRAHSLLDKIRAIAPGQLGLMGTAFLEWLSAVHNQLAPRLHAMI
ncbi:MAG: hypothetical protein JO272_12455 [Pseudonocardiales bacterium]|nr:hypothetical protein [Pseudonocardiales bacterium]